MVPSPPSHIFQTSTLYMGPHVSTGAVVSAPSPPNPLHPSNNPIPEDTGASSGPQSPPGPTRLPKPSGSETMPSNARSNQSGQDECRSVEPLVTKAMTDRSLPVQHSNTSAATSSHGHPGPTIDAGTSSGAPPLPVSVTEFYLPFRRNPYDPQTAVPSPPTDHAMQTLLECTQQFAIGVKTLQEAVVELRKPVVDSPPIPERLTKLSQKQYNGPKHHKDNQLNARVRKCLEIMERRTDKSFPILPPMSPTELDQGPTVGQFRVRYDLEPKHPFNDRAVDIILKKFLATWVNAGYDRTVVRDQIFTHIRGRHQKWLNLNTKNPVDVAMTKTRNRRTNRRHDLFVRRYETVMAHRALHGFIPLLRKLDTDGMSSDETDSETHPTEYFIHRRKERSNELTTFLRDLDTLQLLTVHYNPAGQAKAGQPPHHRKESLLPSASPPQTSLPKPCYGASFLTSLRLNEDDDQEIELNIDYSSHLTADALCLPDSLKSRVIEFRNKRKGRV
ncbi:hypothetical protein SISSUDRAFT_1066663 [Sistotremastrum suecicum HHB10207 ss-3]|uniref:Uncharacterized protein n=1 Tax=Sistotremastrum suecicum HHB10207 ss-3 TaxID=1314776 RepID=A0A165Y1U9_9AGAM|nr:hypothetical protein SISSUDRAFT_1066663 [Sistotremastrum suecicum HHB10207 ss-3]